MINSPKHCIHGSLTSTYGWTIQVLLATLAFACLIVKRFCEPKRYRRTWLIWLFDTSKQGFGAIVVHFSNIILAELFSVPDPCTLYIISFLLDSSLGLAIIYCLIKLTESIAIKYKKECLLFGEYGKPIQLKYWVIQCIAYVVIVMIEKLIITLVIQLRFWDHIRDIILWPLIMNPEVEVLIVILIIPFFVNVLMFWVTDNFLTMHRIKQDLNLIKMNETRNNDLTTFTISPLSISSSVSSSIHGPNGSLGRNDHFIIDDDAELIDISFEPDNESMKTSVTNVC